MARKRYRPEEIFSRLRWVQALRSQGMAMVDAIRRVCVKEGTYYRWREQNSVIGADYLKRLNEFDKENQRLCRAVFDLNLDKLILTEAAKGPAPSLAQHYYRVRDAGGPALNAPQALGGEA